LEELTYWRGQLSVERLQQEIAEYWTALEVSPELQSEATSAGLTRAMLGELDPADAISIRVDSSGVDPATVALVVAFAPTANRVLKDLWTTVLLPRIRSRWGDDAVGNEIRHDD
jgi:hypothetical protein